MLPYQDGSDHECVEGAPWNLIVTVDDVTNEQHPLDVLLRGGGHPDWSSFLRVHEMIERRSIRSPGMLPSTSKAARAGLFLALGQQGHSEVPENVRIFDRFNSSPHLIAKKYELLKGNSISKRVEASDGDF